jgi:hypothetical protein
LKFACANVSLTSGSAILNRISTFLPVRACCISDRDLKAA